MAMARMNNHMMMRPSLLLALLVLLIAVAATSGQGNNNNNNNKGNNGNNNNNNNNGNGGNNNNNNNGNGGSNNNNNGNGNGNGAGNNGKGSDKKGPPNSSDSASTEQQRAVCKKKGVCNYKVLTCPKECPKRKPKKNKKVKGCFIDCTAKCEATCKWRKPKCTGYGSLCYDPRFVGGDGVMFYFHGAKGGNFAIVSDDTFQINAHFIGTRPQGRTRDFTWVQALSVMFDTHTLVVAARRLPQWQDNLDALIVAWDGESVSIPKEGESEWKLVTDENKHVVVERTDDLNTVRVAVSGIVDMAIKIRPIGKEEDRIHNYQIPSQDSFAHLEIQFKFSNLSDAVEGVLGKTYRPDYVSPVKVGVPMPMMGGEDKYATPTLYSTVCRACRFERPSSSHIIHEYDLMEGSDGGVVAQ